MRSSEQDQIHSQLTTSDNVDKKKIEVISLESHSYISNNSMRILTICRETHICMLSVGLIMYKLQRLKVIYETNVIRFKSTQ